jgi:hypothetical protein
MSLLNVLLDIFAIPRVKRLFVARLARGDMIELVAEIPIGAAGQPGKISLNRAR